jgi:hypothetical protein
MKHKSAAATKETSNIRILGNRYKIADSEAAKERPATNIVAFGMPAGGHTTRYYNRLITEA